MEENKENKKNIKNIKLNLIFVFTIIFEVIFLFILSFYLKNFRFQLWLPLPFILLTGLITVLYRKTIIHFIAFFIVNLSPIIMILCNIINFHFIFNNSNIWDIK